MEFADWNDLAHSCCTHDFTDLVVGMFWESICFLLVTIACFLGLLSFDFEAVKEIKHRMTTFI